MNEIEEKVAGFWLQSKGKDDFRNITTKCYKITSKHLLPPFPKLRKQYPLTLLLFSKEKSFSNVSAIKRKSPTTF